LLFLVCLQQLPWSREATECLALFPACLCRGEIETARPELMLVGGGTSWLHNATERGCMKKLNPWCLAAIASVAPLGALGGAMGAVAGHAAVLAITLGIFVGTLSLGRTTANQSSTASETPVVLDERDAVKRRSLPA